VVNTSISGETTGGGLERLPRALQLHKPAIVIVALGANDGLRGLPISVTQGNLTRIVAVAKQAGAQVMLLGMRMPPNYGPRYTADFARLFQDIARQHRLAFAPFLLEGVALNSKMLLDDGLHPNARAQPAILETVWRPLIPLLKKR
jgi:acyl-CoA thioesterase-1